MEGLSAVVRYWRAWEGEGAQWRRRGLGQRVRSAHPLLPVPALQRGGSSGLQHLVLAPQELLAQSSERRSHWEWTHGPASRGPAHGGVTAAVPSPLACCPISSVHAAVKGMRAQAASST